jgi:pimeloyl-ACP methyl ester carboxylesterase
MKRPLFGIGHSMGGNNLVNLSFMHPQLFQSLILIDPVLANFMSGMGNVTPAQASAVRRDRWPTRKIAAQSFQKSKFYQSWDPRVLDLWIKYGLRDLPTKLYPDVRPAIEPYGPDNSEVTLTTTKHQEVMTFVRPVHDSDRASLAGFTEEEKKQLRSLTHPEIGTLAQNPSIIVYRTEGLITFKNLPFLRPSVLYIFGELSPMSAYCSMDKSRTSEV